MRDERDVVPEAVEAVGAAVIEAAFKVHRTFGPGLLEGAYEAFLAHELERCGHKVTRQLALPVVFDGLKVDLGYRMDLVVDGLVVVEVKAVEQLAAVHDAQLITYLRLSGLRLGFLINFNVELLKEGIHRVVNGDATDDL